MGGCPSGGVRASFDTAAAQPTQDAPSSAATQDAAEDGGPKGAGRKLIERALVDLGIGWEDVMSYQVHDDRIVIVEGPVGFKRTYMFPGAGEVGERAEPA